MMTRATVLMAIGASMATTFAPLSPAVAAPKNCADLPCGKSYMCQFSDGDPDTTLVFAEDASSATFNSSVKLICGCESTGTLAHPKPGASKSFTCALTVTVVDPPIAFLLVGRVSPSGTKITGSNVGSHVSGFTGDRGVVQCSLAP
jgi:hypothetical protein